MWRNSLRVQRTQQQGSYCVSWALAAQLGTVEAGNKELVAHIEQLDTELKGERNT